MIINVWAAYDWFQRVKDKEFESNSQRCLKRYTKHETGFSVSKIKNLKAIHNTFNVFKKYH